MSVTFNLGDKDMEFPLGFFTLEIIGNIYANPELLKMG